MCGIAGIINFNKTFDNSLVKKMLKAMEYRGPDSFQQSSGNFYQIGMVRLSIVDLSKNAEQPFYDEKNKVKVIYNGEIDATKIPDEWYSWMHHTKNKIENLHNLKKYSWQKEHLYNQTGTDKSYHPNKTNNEIEKKYKTWKK